MAHPLWKRRINTVLLRQELHRLHIDADRVLILDIGADSLIQNASSLLIKHGLLEEEIRVDDAALPELRDALRRRQISISWSFVRMLATKQQPISLTHAPTSSVEPVG